MLVWSPIDIQYSDIESNIDRYRNTDNKYKAAYNKKKCSVTIDDGSTWKFKGRWSLSPARSH